MAQAAAPPASGRAVQSGVPPAANVTVPVGVPAAGAAAATVAVNVTGSPWTDGAGDAPTVTSTPPARIASAATPVAPSKLPSPEYVAVRPWLATASAEVVHVATPSERAAAAQSTSSPAEKRTVPPGVAGAPPAAATVAVNVTACPVRAGLGAAASWRVEEAAWTAWTASADEAVSSSSPDQVAVTACTPTPRPETVHVASPATTAAAAQSVVAPSSNDTVPPGVATAGAVACTVAVNVTGWPGVDGLGLAPALRVEPPLTTATDARRVEVFQEGPPPYVSVRA